MAPSVSAATMFLNAMKIKDLSQAPLAESISYNGPLCGEPIRGRDLVTRFLSVFLPVLKDVRVIRHIADGDYVATIWQADTSFGEVSLVYVLRLEAGKIAEIQAFYDPRGFLERLGT